MNVQKKERIAKTSHTREGLPVLLRNKGRCWYYKWDMGTRANFVRELGIKVDSG